MPKLIFVATEEEKAAWKEAAYAERLSLSEWLRRAANDRSGLVRIGRPRSSEATYATQPTNSNAGPTHATAPVPTPASAVGDGVPPPGQTAAQAAQALQKVASARPLHELSEHRADPKEKAAMEHGKRERKAAGGMCEHRVPVGSYCKRCEEAA